MTTKHTTPKTAKKRQNTSKPRKPRKPKVPATETLEDIPFLASEPVRKRARKTPPAPKEKTVKSVTAPAKKVPFQKGNLPVLSQKIETVPVSAPAASAFLPKSFETYCLHHWGKINLYFLLPASISPPLLGLWLTPAGMTTGFAILVFISVWGIANCLSFLLVLLIWALKGNR